MVRRALLLVAVAAVAGCGGGAMIAERQLPRLVLQPGDLPGFDQFDNRRQARADQGERARADLGRFGRIDGWIARYRPSDPAARRGLLVVESRVDLFSSSGGAKKDLAAYKDEYAVSVADTAGTLLADLDVGQDTVAISLRQGAVRFFFVAWREANATASIVAQGFALDADAALELAQKQERRLKAAAR